MKKTWLYELRAAGAQVGLILVGASAPCVPCSPGPCVTGLQEEIIGFVLSLKDASVVHTG